MPTLGNGETLALIQGLKGALLREMVGYAGQTTGTLEQVADGNGLVKYTLGMDGTITSGAITISSGNLTLSSGNLVITNGTTSGMKAPSISATTAGAGPTALTAAQSGSIILFDKVDGAIFTLPAPSVGLEYTFLVDATVTSNSYKVITDAGTTFLLGTLVNVDTDTSNAVAAWTGNGTSHVAVTMAAAGTNATGGIKGTRLDFVCVSSTLWVVTGFVQGAGTVATPFATS